jgi:hypothetical protein
MATQGQRGHSSPEHRREGQAGKPGAGQTHPNPASEPPGAGGVAATVKNKAQEAASAVGATASEAWENLRQGAQSAASTLASTGEDVWEEVTRFVRRYPIVTFAAGAGVGSLLACALLPSRSRYRSGDWRKLSSRSATFESQPGYYGPGRRSPEPYGYREERGREQYEGHTGGTGASQGQEQGAGVGQWAGQAWESTKQGAQQVASAVAQGRRPGGGECLGHRQRLGSRLSARNLAGGRRTRLRRGEAVSEPEFVRLPHRRIPILRYGSLIHAAPGSPSRKRQRRTRTVANASGSE